jgi:hypothetical protein
MFVEAPAKMPVETIPADSPSGRLYDIVVPGIFFGTMLARGVPRERAEEYVREWNYAEAAESILPRRLFVRLARPPVDAPAHGVRGMAARLQRSWKARRFSAPSLAAARRSLLRSPLMRAAALRFQWSRPAGNGFPFPRDEERYDVTRRCLTGSCQ